MAISVSDVLAAVRPELSDEVAPYRWADSLLVRLTGNAQRELYRRHPESAYTDAAIVTTEPAFPTAIGSALGVRDFYLEALAHYVCWQALMQDSEDAQNKALAAAHLARWQELVV